jgi:hypothetical protein
MLRALKQVRTAASLLDPEAVRRIASRPLAIELHSADGDGYAEMEDFLAPAGVDSESRQAMMEGVFRAGDVGAPDAFDISLRQPGAAAPRASILFVREDKETTIDAILDEVDNETSLPLARRFPVFRPAVVERIVSAVARENALFALASALPNIVPNLIELPWAVGEFASDTAVLTMNQARMAFLVAAACGREIGASEQKAELISIAAGAFGWRAIARELAGKIPFGGGLVAKGAIAYAGTYVIGKGLAHFNRAGRRPSRAERKAMYRDAMQKGRQVAEGLRKELL